VAQPNPYLHRSPNLPAGAGAKAARLAEAQRAGLAVPSFWVLPEEALQAMLHEGLVTQTNGSFHMPDPLALHRRLLPKDAPESLAIRSAFSAEDAANRSLAGHFESVLRVPANNPAAAAAALCMVWDSAKRLPDVQRRDVMLMAMVEAKHAGVAFSEAGYRSDLVNMIDGTADRLVAGEADGERFELPRKGHVRLSTRDDANQNSGWPSRLQRLLHEVRRHFGDRPWDIEWADDGERCWLVQVRPITRRTLRNELFTMANHREILPDPPSRFMTTLIGACAQDLFSYYRRFDRRLPADRPFIEILHGRPLINLSLLLDMMHLWGLPSRLVTNSIGGDTEAGEQFGPHAGRLVRALPALIKQGLAQLRAPQSAKRQATRLMEIAIGTEASADNAACAGIAGLTKRAGQVYTLLVQEMFSLTAAISGPTSLLRRTGTLALWSQHHRSASTQMFDDLRRVAEALEKTPGAHEATQRGEVPAGEPFASAWSTWLRAYGHRGVYESDLAMPRFREQLTSLLPALLRHDEPEATRARMPLRAWLLYPVWRQARAAIAAREQLRSDAMRAFGELRARLLCEAERMVDGRQLPTAEHLWKLSIEECLRLQEGWVPDAAFWQQRETEEARRASLQVPDVLRRFDALPETAESAASERNEWRGIGLTEGVVTGIALVCKRPFERLPDGFEPANTIVVARAVDAGWIPAFHQARGVAVEIGGDLSHGSIILRELNLPAVTNMAGITSAVRTGDHIRIDARQGLVERISRTDEPGATAQASGKHTAA
jgi:rifampicin phosphotransferase